MRCVRTALLSFSNFATPSFLTPNFLAITLCTLLLTAISMAQTQDRILRPIESSGSVTLAKSLHAKAKPQHDQGAVDPQTRLDYLTLVISPSASQQRALEKLMAEQQDPASPNYHKWLMPEEYGNRFGLSQNDVNKITAWLTARGLTIISVGGGRNTIVFSGTAQQIAAAFQTEVHRYKIGSEEHFANSTPVKIPGAWSGVVTGIRGLDSFRTVRTRTSVLLHPTQ